MNYEDFDLVDLERGYADGSIQGWIPPDQRSIDQSHAHEDAMNEMPSLFLGFGGLESEKVDLTELWSHPAVVQALGYAFPGVHQYTGSCVGAGGGNMFATLMMIEILRLNELEKINVPFWLLPYGRSRLYAGMRSPGEGSLGSTFAKAAKEDGIIEATHSGLPPFKNQDGLSWFASAERSWSDGDAQQTMNLLSESRQHPIKTVSLIRTTDELDQGIRKLYTCTNATVLIPNARVESDGEAYGRVARGGGHQTTFLGTWRHPVKGKRYFKYVNQWGLGWGKNGMCWIPDEDAQRILNENETFLFSQFEGWPDIILPPDVFDIIGR